MGDNSQLTVTVSAGSGIEPGDTVSGKISKTEVKDWESKDGDMILFFEITLEADGVNFEFSPWYSAGPKDSPRVTPESLLGQLIERFGVELAEDDELALHEIFAVGTPVEFEVYEREYTADDGTQKTTIDCDRETLRKSGEPKPESKQTGLDLSGSDDEEGADDGEGADDEEASPEMREEVIDFVRDAAADGKTAREIKTEVVKRGGAFLEAYSELMDDDTIVNDGDDVEVNV